MGVKFKTHTNTEGHTEDIIIRVSRIDNGFVIKAGGPPRHVADEVALQSEVGAMLGEFAKQGSAKKKP